MIGASDPRDRAAHAVPEDSPRLPGVTIIIPVFNTASFLEQCVNSVLDQTYRDLEIILVDDGSTDQSAAICDEYQRSDERVHVIHQANAGLSEARNSGLAHASGARVMFLDSDDWLAPECVEVLQRLLVDGDAHVALCGTARVAGPSQMHRDDDSRGKNHYLAGDEFLSDPSPFEPVHAVSACGKLIDRNLLADLRFPSGRLHEDVFLTHTILHRAERLGITSRVLHYYRQQRPGSITAGTMPLKSASDKARAHLQRAFDLESYGLSEVAGLEFRRGFGWHMRVVATTYDKSRVFVTDAQRAELSEQRTLIRQGLTMKSLGPRARAVVCSYSIAPGRVARLYAAVLSRRPGAHRIEGEKAAP